MKQGMMEISKVVKFGDLFYTENVTGQTGCLSGSSKTLKTSLTLELCVCPSY